MIVMASTDWVAVALPLGIPLLSGVLAWVANGIRADHTRRKQLYADAFAAVVAYQEFPFRINRRRAPIEGHEEIGNEERLRISEALHEVQQSISNYRAQLSTESPAVSARYDALVTRSREIAGSAMREAWKGPPLDNDAGMNMSVNYNALVAPEDEYLAAAKKDVKWCKAPRSLPI
ncbi:MAG TPA: hypothetical protein VMB51_03660 [Solirubrobacteraceae bacterium]|nr:hypothetical protein [Solirubrobacteraceae bacterium]